MTDTAAASASSLSDDFAPAGKTTSTQGLARPSLSYWQDAWIRLKKNQQALVSLGIIVALLLFTAIGPLIWTADYTEQDLTRISEAPSLKKTAVVLPELDDFNEIVLPEENPPVTRQAAELDGPANLAFMGEPSTQAVRLKWDRVPGASSYAVYRSDREPKGHDDLGVPVGETDGGNKVSYEDKFDLEAVTYYYSVVPKKDGEEGPKFATIKTALPTSISITDAQKLNPNAQMGQKLLLPAHPLGTDYLGRDLLARLMAGARISLFIGLFAPLLATIIGVILGGISGYAGGRTDEWLMRFTDFVMALPFLLFMILFKVVSGGGAGESGVMPMLVSMVVLTWTGPARLVRGQILQLRESEFVEASKLLGAKPWYLIWRHLLPNTMGVVLVSLTFSIPTAIFTEAFLSFIGMGVVPPTPSWGSMCDDGIKTFLNHPHEFFFPALLISLAVLAFNLFGDGLRDALDPRMRSVQ